MFAGATAFKQNLSSWGGGDFLNFKRFEKLRPRSKYRYSKRQIEGNQKLLAKYKHDESPWLVRLFSSGSKLFKGEMKTD